MSARSKRRRPPDSAPQRSRTYLIVLGLLATACVFLVWQSWRTWNVSPSGGVPPPIIIEAPPLPALSASPYLESMRDASYVGSQACVECHRDQHASYLQTAHSRSFSAIDPRAEPPDGQFARADTAWRYQAYRSEGRLHHREFLATSGGQVTLADRPLKYLVGSGRFARTYLAEIDGILVESPVTWYASLNAWNFSPGFQWRPHDSFSRNINADCLYCHVGRADFPPDSENRAQLHELAIGCERCHGPGSVHVARRQSGAAQPSGQDLTIVHPKLLSRELSEAICHQCHLETDASAVVRGRRREEFRPGLRWTDFVVNFAEDASDDMTVTGHVQQMHLSRCYQQSQTMTCVTCHDPHQVPAPSERREYYRAACLECHTDAACKLPLVRRTAEKQDDCAACHMPQSATNIAHVAFTHHRIGIHQEQPAAPGADRPVKLAPVLDVSHLSEADRERMLGVALARLVSQHEDDPRYQPLWSQAEVHLQIAASQGVRDPAVETVLAVIARRRGDTQTARAAAEAALAGEEILPGDRAIATGLLAELEFQQGQFDQAKLHFEQLTQWRLMPIDWFLLGTCRARMGDEAGAIAAFEMALQLDATAPVTYRTLANLYQAQGKSERAKELLERAALLEEHLAKLPN